MTDTRPAPSQPPTKFSRYRSVRHAVPADPPSNISNERSKDNMMQRTKSMARYRRPNPKVAFQVDNQAQPPMPSTPLPDNQNPRTTSRRAAEPIAGQHERLLPGQSPSEGHAETAIMAGRGQRRPETENERLRRKVKEFQEREAEVNKPQLDREEQERAYISRKAHAERDLQKEKSQAEEAMRKQRHEVEQARSAEEEAAWKMKEQKRKDLERLERELESATSGSPPLPPKSPKREKFGFFQRRNGPAKNADRSNVNTSVAGPPVPFIAIHASGDVSRPAPPLPAQAPQKISPRIPSQAPKMIGEVSNQMDTSKMSSKKKAAEPQMIEAGGGGIVPQIDAPVSASNAGERRVLVRCKQSSVNLPVTPETTPKEIIYSAANFMTQNIIPSTAILTETYNQLGLERRVRRYENVRDVMNSWDRDTQNSFSLSNSDTPRFDTDLELSGVPKEAPADITVYMYHSQKPGTWVKRYITLLSSGQMYVHKRDQAKLGDKNTVAICHLSDYDIYTATPQQLRKVLKPPKRYCHAVKSQQKTAVFLNTENFVHFFSTDNEELATKWYDAVQSWRSWYLVNRLGSGRKAKKTAEVKATNAGSPLLAEVADETPYLIGSFAGLGLDDFRSGSDDEDFDTEDEERPRQIPFHLRNSVILTGKEVRREAKRHPPVVAYRIPSNEEEEFTSGGLLGRSYTTRQQKATYQQQQQQDQVPAGPFTNGDNLLNRDQPRTMSIQSQSQSNSNSSGSGGLARSGSRAKPKPLLDFTPQFKEAPQWDKTGKGHGVAPVAGKLLVDVATTPENPMGDLLPRSNVFRREIVGANGTNGDGGGRPGTSAGGGRSGGGGLTGGINRRPGTSAGNGASAAGVMSRGRVRYD